MLVEDRIRHREAQRSVSHQIPLFKSDLQLIVPLLPIQYGSSPLCLDDKVLNTGSNVWEVQVFPEGQHWSCISRFGHRPRGHQSINIRAWTSYRQQSLMASLIETLCKGQYHRAVYHTLIIWGMPLWLSDSTPAGIMRCFYSTNGWSVIRLPFGPVIWTTTGHIAVKFECGYSWSLWFLIISGDIWPLCSTTINSKCLLDPHSNPWRCVFFLFFFSN